MKKLINYLKARIYLGIRTYITVFQSNEKIFTKIYYNNGWGGKDSVSGSGSSLENTKEIIRFLPLIFKTFGIKKILDIPCGDFNWMKEVDSVNIQYFGADIVKDLVDKNNQRYSNDQTIFFEADLTQSKLPNVDLILCRDCLGHLSYKEISRALKNIKASGAKYLLTTTFPHHQNKNIINGDWRPINLNAPPFNLPLPIELYFEKCQELNGQYADKSLGLWHVNDIPVN